MTKTIIGFGIFFLLVCILFIFAFAFTINAYEPIGWNGKIVIKNLNIVGITFACISVIISIVLIVFGYNHSIWWEVE